MPNLSQPCTLFISDIHLKGIKTPLFALFEALLTGPAYLAEKVYILGDLFDYWVGPDIHPELQAAIGKLIKGLSERGISVYFMPGNRDFLIQNKHLAPYNCQVLSDPTLIDLYGTPTLLAHGDALCIEDVAYQRFRRLVQHPVTKWLFLHFPRRLRAALAEKARAKSRAYQGQAPKSILDVTPEAVIKLMEKYEVNTLLHGHVHKAQFHHLEIAGQSAHRLVLGDWHDKASVIIANKNQRLLTTYHPQTGFDIIEQL